MSDAIEFWSSTHDATTDMWRCFEAFTRFAFWQLAPGIDLPGSGSPIAALEKLKDRILTVVNSSPGLSEDTPSMWSGDAKEMYYTVVLVDQLLSHGGDT